MLADTRWFRWFRCFTLFYVIFQCFWTWKLRRRSCVNTPKFANQLSIIFVFLSRFLEQTFARNYYTRSKTMSLHVNHFVDQPREQHSCISSFIPNKNTQKSAKKRLKYVHETNRKKWLPEQEGFNGLPAKKSCCLTSLQSFLKCKNSNNNKWTLQNV